MVDTGEIVHFYDAKADPTILFRRDFWRIDNNYWPVYNEAGEYIAYYRDERRINI